MYTRKYVRVITNDQGERLYCLDDICEDLGLESVTIPLTDKGEAVYEAPSADGSRTYTFVTLVALNKVLNEVGTPEAKAMQYQVTRGVYACPTVTGRVFFNAEDVALCLGYEDPDEAIKKYCKSAKEGFIGASDVRRLVARSKLSTAERFGAFIAGVAKGWGQVVNKTGVKNMAMLRGTPIFW